MGEEDSIADVFIMLISSFDPPTHRNIQEGVPMNADISHGDNESSGETPSAGNMEVADTGIKSVRIACSQLFRGSKPWAFVKVEILD